MKYYTDDFRLCREVPRKGKSPQVHIFLERRAAMTFPTVHNPGYYCVFGLKEIITHRDKRPLEMLAEGKSNDQTKLFQGLITAMRTLHCTHVYADCSKEFQSGEIEFDHYCARVAAKGVELYDASEFEGFDNIYATFNAANAPLDEMGRKGLIRVPGMFKKWGDQKTGRFEGDSILAEEFRVLSKVLETNKESKPWFDYPAINAFNHIIMSYVISPYQRPEKQTTTRRSEGYGG